MNFQLPMGSRGSSINVSSHPEGGNDLIDLCRQFLQGVTGADGDPVDRPIHSDRKLVTIIDSRQRGKIGCIRINTCRS